MSQPDLPWEAGAATGIGSLPGTDPHEAVRLVLGELPELPYLPELPERGPGSDLVGRTAAQLVDLHVDRQPSGWRLVGRAGLDERRARDALQADLDALGEAAEGWVGPLKVQLCGPWTLLAGVELPRGGSALADAGAVRDVVGSLAETVGGFLDDVRRRVPGAALILQLDEPALPAVLAGRVPTASGFGRLAPVAETTAEQALHGLVERAGVPVAVHCCAADPPLSLLRRTGARAVAVDATLLGIARPGPLDDAFGNLVEAGVALWLGLVPSVGLAEPSEPRSTVAPVRQLWRRLGFDAGSVGSRVVVTPTCGLAAASPTAARAALAAVRAAARSLVDELEDP